MIPLETVLDALQRGGGMVTTLGIEFTVDDEGDPSCRMEITPELTGAPGVAHGGAVATLLDTALGMAAMAHSLSVGRATSTVEIKVNFLRPAKQGTVLVTNTTIQSAGRSLLVVSGTAYDEDTGEKVGLAVGTFNLFSLEAMARKREQ